MSVSKPEPNSDAEAESSSNSNSADAVTGASGNVEFVRVHIGSEAYVFELGCVNKLVRSPSLARVPRTPPTIAGVAEIQGNVTAAIDGRTLLEADYRKGVTQRILVVFARMTHDQMAGILVDGIEGIVTYPVDMIAPSNSAGEPEEPDGDWFKAVVDEKTWVFDPEQLTEAARRDSDQQVN